MMIIGNPKTTTEIHEFKLHTHPVELLDNFHHDLCLLCKGFNVTDL